MIEFFTTLTTVESIFLFFAVLGSLFFIMRGTSLLLGFSSNDNSYGDGDVSGDIPSDSGDVSLFQDVDGNGIPDLLESGDIHTDIDTHLDINMDADLDTDVHVEIPEASSFHAHDVEYEGHEFQEALEADGLPVKVKNKVIEFSLQNISAFIMMFGWVGLAMTKSSGFSVIPAMLAGGFAGIFAAWLLTKLNQILMKLRSSGNKQISSSIGKIGVVYLRIPAEGTGQIQVEVSGRLETCDAESLEKIEIPYGTKVQVVKVKENNVLCVTSKILDI